MTSTLTLGLRARNAAPAKQRYQICLIHPFDPRGQKVGGLETYIRDFITFHPTDTDILFVGVDFDRRPQARRSATADFPRARLRLSPILHYSDQQAREAARTIRSSLTGQFFMALLRYFGPVSRLIRERGCTVDLRRVEFSWLPTLLRRPFIQMLHGEGAPKLQMDLAPQEVFVRAQYRRAFRGHDQRKISVRDPFITERLQKTYPGQSGKIDTLWTWVNTDIFKPQPFPAMTEPFRIIFAGRLDEFKDPPLMFSTIARLRERCMAISNSIISGPAIRIALPEVAAIEDITIRHGFKDAVGMAATLANAHAGILTSEFEGMPRCVLETLAVGRPVVAVHLPQLESVIHDGESGYLISRSSSATR